jgi:AcrR family transcriptional regulator
MRWWLSGEPVTAGGVRHTGRMTRPKATLGRSDWIEAGQRLLIDGGFSSLKLAALTRELGVTSGSFYHHFGDFREYLDALADYYGRENIDRVVEALSPIPDPAERLRVLHTLRDDWSILRLDSAMRVWATSNDRARMAVARLDDEFIELIRGAFAELGFSHDEARIRALLAFSAGVGQPFLFGRPPNTGDSAQALEILIASGDRRVARS